ncbi:MAG: prepilin-type N-terminal cleavage/methylation domain-containing protein [Clostridiales bacterium]|nr:prepilin-type N-terminal cleavage/methylation domain-containing protein [Clostridiales bacterium]
MKKIKINSGFTMIETIFSLVIFLILYIVISFLITTIAKNSYDARYNYIATTLVQKRYEEIKATKEIIEGCKSYKYEDFIIEEEITKVEEYKSPVYKFVISVYKDDKILETLEGLKVIK